MGSTPPPAIINAILGLRHAFTNAPERARLGRTNHHRTETVTLIS